MIKTVLKKEVIALLAVVLVISYAAVNLFGSMNEPSKFQKNGAKTITPAGASIQSQCEVPIPDFIEIQKEMRDDGVLFVGVSEDKEGWEVVKPFAKEYGINYPLVVDDGTIRQKYGPFRGIPTTFIINKMGKVEFVAPGMVNREALQPALEELANR